MFDRFLLKMLLFQIKVRMQLVSGPEDNRFHSDLRRLSEFCLNEKINILSQIQIV